MKSGNEITFTVGGRKLSLNRKAVEAALKNVSPDTVKKYSVRVGNHEYPIKQAVAVATGVPIAMFISTDAYRILTRLGFEVRE